LGYVGGRRRIPTFLTSPRSICTPSGRVPIVDERSLGSLWTEPSRTESAERSVALPASRAFRRIGLLSKSAAITDFGALSLFSIFIRHESRRVGDLVVP